MQRIQDPTAVTSQPAPPTLTGQPVGYFQGSIAGGIVTRIRYWWLNMIQEELIGLLVAAGLPLDGSATVLQAVRALFRTKLQANLVLYVSPTGSDANTGLSPSTAFATLNKAWQLIINSYDLAGFNVTVNVASGNYGQGLTAAGAPTGFGSGNSVAFVGNNGSPSSVQISASNSNCVTALNGGTVMISGMQFTATGSGSNGNALFAQAGGNITFNSVIFGGCGNSHIQANAGGIVSCATGGSYVIGGNAASHLSALSGAVVVANASVTTTGSPAFSTAFALAQILGNIEAYSTSWPGSTVGGVRYQVSSNSVINTNGGGTNFLPGSTAGSSSSGGQYI